jgi:ssDNA-binding Zn-finger/Zn-ribbon topoisomerase 1
MIEWIIIGGAGYLLGKLMREDRKQIQGLTDRENSIIQILQKHDNQLKSHEKIILSHEERLQFLENNIGTWLNDVRCKICGRPRVIRKNWKEGSFFLGCSGYPDNCRSTVSMDQNLITSIAVRRIEDNIQH